MGAGSHIKLARRMKFRHELKFTQSYPKIKLSPFLKDITLTTITSIVVIISMIFITRFLAVGLGPDGFGAYSLARRIVSFIIPFSTLSMGIALTRYIAISTDEEKRNGYFVSAIFIVLCSSLVVFFAGCLGGKHLSVLIFHDSKYLMLLYSSFFMIVGLAFSTILYSYCRGIQRMDMANLWQICNIAILPLIISYIFAQQQNVALIVFLMGLSSFLSIFPLTILLKRIEWRKVAKLKVSIKTLLKYSIPRTPGGIALGGLFTIGPFLAPYFGTMRDAGYLVVGQSVFRITGAAIVAFGMVALPKVSQIVAQGRTDFLKNRISDILNMIIHLGLFTVIQLFIWSDEIVLIWLGQEYLAAVPIIKIFLISLCPYLGYVILRSIVDAVEAKAINTLNLFVSFGVTAVLSIIFGYTGLGIWGLALAVTIGLFILGISTAYFLVKRYKITFNNLRLMWILIMNGIFAVISIFAKQCFIESFNDVGLLVAIFVIEISLFTLYIWFLYKKDMQWIMELKARIFPKTIQN